MILNTLVQMAHQEKLLDTIHLQSKPVHWLIHINQQGQVLQVIENISIADAGKGKATYANLPIPARRGRSGKAIRPDLMVDKSDYLLGFNLKHSRTETITAKMAKDAEWLQDCFNACLAETRQIAAESHSKAADAQVKAMQWIYNNLDAFAEIWCGGDGNTQDAFHAHGAWIKVPKAWKKNHLLGFRLESRDVWSYPEVDQHLAKLKSQEMDGEEEGEGRCLVTGDFGPLVRLHAQVSLPGEAKPLPLISCNLQAFMHYGLLKNQNAQIGKAASLAFNLSLRRLLGEGDFTHLKKRHYKISNKTTALFWSEQAGDEDDAADSLFPEAIFSGELESDIEEVLAAYHAPRKDGKPALLFDTTRIYTVTLTREKSRAILRNATLTTVKDVAQSLTTFFKELEVPLVYGDPNRSYRRISQLTWAIERPESKQGKEQENLSSRLFECALDRHKKYPQALLARVLERIRALDSEGPSRRRMALIKAVLIRTFKNKEYLEMDQKEPGSPAYLLGKLFATLERIQYVATKAKANIVQRYFGAASTTPAMVFPRLIKLSAHHLHKVGGGFEAKYKKHMDAILGTYELTTFPSTLSLEAQGEFMLGYHQQRYQFTQQDEDREDKKIMKESEISQEEQV